MRSFIPLLVLVLTALGCGPGDEPKGFDDHTEAEIQSLAAYDTLSKKGGTLDVVKFAITEFQEDDRQIHYYDSNFFTLHDEWYFFRLLNNARIPGVDTDPYPGSFKDIPAIYTFAQGQSELPVGLRFVGERLYAPQFYAQAIGQGNNPIGAGSLIHVPSRTVTTNQGTTTTEEVWAFELEFTDRPDHAAIVRFFEMLTATLPSAISNKLVWLIRSTPQEELAAQMEAGELRFYDKITRYSELAVQGETEIYAEGLSAGRLKIIKAGEPGLESTSENDILILEEIPDYLPPCAALITALPQTPLAHINVLAKNRGIPNAYLGGVAGDPNLLQLARVNQPVVVLAEGDTLRIQAITASELSQYQRLGARDPISVPQVDLTNAEYTLDLASLSLDEVDAYRPLIGGKAAGFLALLAPGNITIPDAPLVVTARAYAEHLEPLLPKIQSLLEHPLFRRDPRARYFALEGSRAYQIRFSTQTDIDFGATLLERDDIIGEFVREGGLTEVIEDTPLDPQTLSALDERLRLQFPNYDAEQGLRFRSSSTVEDIEGFNGAGLYTSNSGFIEAVSSGSNRTVERALKRTWRSYWGSEAFEERELAQVDHLSGNMAVLVHARFDDDKEVSNSVFTMTKMPPESQPLLYELVVNVQKGALSITNPEPGSVARPEVDVVTLRLENGVEVLEIERRAASTEVSDGDYILDDERLETLFEQARAVTDAALLADNLGRASFRARRTLTLDFEMREMAAPWPLLVNSPPDGSARMVIKQARSLEPGILGIPETVLNQPFPRDVTERATIVERWECDSASVSVRLIEAYTDPLRGPDLGYGETPFTAFFNLDFQEDALGYLRGDRLTVTHENFLSLSHPEVEAGEGWGISLSSGDAESPLVLEVNESGLSVQNGEGSVNEATSCERTLLFSTPDLFLRSLFDEIED